MMKVLHITNWYPTKENPYAALWIKRHIQALSKHTKNVVYHFEIVKGPFRFKKERISDFELSYTLTLPIKFWKLYEFLGFIFFCYFFFWKTRVGKPDLLNVHIAYPLLTYFNLVKKYVRIPVVITEHWSAYHYHFNIPGSSKLNAIRRIFKQGIPVITVSKALGDDIAHFANVPLNLYAVPNIVDSEVFKNEKPSVQNVNDRFFFMVSQWKSPKIPMVAISAYAELAKRNSNISLKIAGYGPLLDEMKSCSLDLDVQFLGQLDSKEIAGYMQHAIALVHASEYETFCVVCAEALACGCPVIASAVGGIPEFVNEDNGFLVMENTSEAFTKAMQSCLSESPKMEHVPNLSPQAVGWKYYEVLKEIESKYHADS
ncbi:glycosyltransferase [Marinoscillum sp. MHG1-6]|uniref:glycosyltransferase n=1 Tax=Marinoscillum sp. MHG1-6 TaxID=2959627 RepID=UPI002157DCDD|nr:glycosyltransferase [Marinoscillum sp. MHG1-6]